MGRPGAGRGATDVQYRRGLVGGARRSSLFVRERKRDGRGETLPYHCLGYAR